MNVGVPRRTLALIAANGLSAASQGQFMFVLPWMLLARGHTPRDAALATGFLYVPLLVFAIPAGLASDRLDPRRVLGRALAATLVAAALFPVAALAGHDWFWLVLVAAVVLGIARNYAEGAVMRGLADTTEGSSLLRAHAIRTTVNQAALFGGPFLGLLLFRAGGVSAVMLCVCALNAAALALARVLPQLGHRPPQDGGEWLTLSAGLASLRESPPLRAIAWANASWNVFSGAALGLMPAVLRQHVGLDEVEASATLIAGAVAVIVGTLPLVRAGQRRAGAAFTFLLAGAAQAVAVLLLAGDSLALIAPLAYIGFQLANSAAAASLNGARALAAGHVHQALLSLVIMAAGMIGFVTGLVLAAWAVGAFGFGVALVLIGIGFAVVAAGFRRPLAVAP